MALARRFNALNSKFALACVIVMVSLTALCREFLVGCFTKDEEVMRITMVALLVCCTWLVADGMQGYYQGPIRALGLQQIASYMAIGCYWVIGVPSACIFAKVCGWGLPGLQVGIGLAVCV